ncbi:MAG: peptidylprolyl isomerase [Cyanobacteria bacterium CRU_2_1]|nr:peptidylprolyl isomerase [Cyanobacteria bacterium RU_5_0]NJR61244.1 peptidylprolyl isomerase [Cyanobacteria bacterium CRU_2_1]
MVSFSGTPIQSEAIVDFLKREMSLKEICQKILYQQIIDKTAQERGVVVTSDEIQAEADRQRYQQRLESSTATYAWLTDQLITPDDWEAGIHDRLLTQKLAESLFASDVEKYFAEHRLDFEQISLYRLTVPYQQLSQELFYQIEENEISFYEAAHLYDIDERRRLQCGYEGRLYRWSLTPEMAAVVFGARLREVLGPFQGEQGYDLFIVEEFVSAELTPETRQEIIDRLFREWLNSELNYLLHSQ